VNQGYLKEFILDPGQPSEVSVHKENPETSQPEGHATQALIHYHEVNAIFSASSIEGTIKNERAIYVNMARRMVLTGPPSTPGRPITFSDADVHAALFPHNDALIVTLLIKNCQVSKILIDADSRVTILYGSALDKMEDTPGMAYAMIN